MKIIHFYSASGSLPYRGEPLTFRGTLSAGQSDEMPRPQPTQGMHGEEPADGPPMLVH